MYTDIYATKRTHSLQAECPSCRPTNSVKARNKVYVLIMQGPHTTLPITVRYI